MKKYILLAAFALVALASAHAQTEELDSMQAVIAAEQAKLDSIRLAQQSQLDSIAYAQQLAEQAYFDSIQEVEALAAAKRAYQDSIQAVIDYEYAQNRINVMADDVIQLDSLQFRPILVVDALGNYYATFSDKAVRFQTMTGRLNNERGQQVRITLNRGQHPKLAFSDIQTEIVVDPETIK